MSTNTNRTLEELIAETDPQQFRFAPLISATGEKDDQLEELRELLAHLSDLKRKFLEFETRQNVLDVFAEAIDSANVGADELSQLENEAVSELNESDADQAGLNRVKEEASSLASELIQSYLHLENSVQRLSSVWDKATNEKAARLLALATDTSTVDLSRFGHSDATELLLDTEDRCRTVIQNQMVVIQNLDERSARNQAQAEDLQILLRPLRESVNELTARIRGNEEKVKRTEPVRQELISTKERYGRACAVGVRAKPPTDTSKQVELLFA